MKTILIADDDSDTVSLIMKALQPLGYEMIGAGSGQEALEKVEQCRPDLLLLDVLMPQGHGFAVCKSLRDRPEFAQMKILFLTSKAYPADREQALLLGADGFINKPFNIEDLQKTVAALLADAGGEDACG